MTPQNAHIKLPVRFRPVHGEATIGYLMRVAKANGFQAIGQLNKTFKNFNAFCLALGLSNDEKQILFGPYPSFWGPNESPDGLTYADFNHSLIRWCPSCLRESSYIRGSWLLKVSGVCGHHAAKLQERCLSCGSLQRLGGVDFERCTCGARLSGSQSREIVSDPILTLGMAFESSIRCPSTFRGFPALSLREWIRLISYLGQFSENNQPAKPGKIANLHYLDTAFRLTEQTSRLLQDWPESFHAVLRAIQCQAGVEAKNKTRIRDTFGTLYHVIYTDLSDPCFQFLRDEFERYLREHWSGVVNKRHRAFKPETIARHPRATLKQAAKIAGVALSTVRHFVRAEVIAGNQIELPSGRKMRSVDEQSLAQIAVLAKSCINLDQAAKQLALPECRVRELISAGILKPLVSRKLGNAATWLIPKQQVQGLFFAGTESSHLPPTISLRHILKHWHLRDGELKALVRALLEHQFELVGKPTESVPLGNILLDVQKVRQWLLEKRYVSGATLSVDEAAQRLSLKQQVVYDLVKLGFLATIQDDLPGRRVTQASLDDFQATYISLAEYAGSLKRAPRWLLQTLQVQPVSGPMIDGSRQYFFRRTDLNS